MSDEKDFDANKFRDDLKDHIHGKVEEAMSGKRRPIVIGIHLGKRSYGGGLLWGVVLTLIGLALLLDHMGIISIDRVWHFWPLLLVYAGIVNFRCPERRFWGILLIFVGALLQFNQLGFAHFRWVDFWPLVFIAAGLLLMWNALEARRRPAASPPEGGDPRTTLNESVVFGGIERRVTTQDFQGGKVSTVFGGVELDLIEANMQGNEATLEIDAIFGGVEIRVPLNWQVVFRGSPIFGGIADKTRVTRSEDPASPNRKLLILTGTVIFAGVEIKN